MGSGSRVLFFLRFAHYQSMTSKRAAFYVDGFNLYHAIDDLKKDNKLQKKHGNLNSIKWLSLFDLANHIRHQKSEYVATVNYYSAIASHTSPGSQARHLAYIEALKATNVRINLGKFRSKPMSCYTCKAQWTSHEEKQTDVNIAVQIVRDALLNTFDVFYLISGDTDLLPAVRAIKEHASDKEIVAVRPPFRRHGNALAKEANRSISLNIDHLKRCKLPNTLVRDGREINCPPEYL